MKENEAPEKVYLLFNRPYLVDYAKLNKRRCEEEVEYTRTDVFIEKVKNFLYKKDDRDSYTIGYIKRHLEEIIKEIGL